MSKRYQQNYFSCVTKSPSVYILQCTTRLKSYFESKECIDFDHSKDTLELSFKIFAGTMEEYSDSGEMKTNDEQMKQD